MEEGGEDTGWAWEGGIWKGEGKGVLEWRRGRGIEKMELDYKRSSIRTIKCE